MDNDKYKKNEKKIFIGLFIFFVLDLIIGAIAQSIGININFLLVPLALLVFPGYAFVFAYYGLYRKVSVFSKGIFIHFGALGYLFYRELSHDNDKEVKEEILSKRIGILFLIIGIILFIAILVLIIRSYILFGIN